ncbi:MAG: sodium:proton antiporter, partial [Parvularcula sp.]|nr:sodium:proton antiporter [Parvularcula sp.]
MELLSLLPPILALALAFLTRNVILSLVLGLAASEILILGGRIAEGFPATLDRIVGVLTSPGDAQIILFCLLIGGLIALMRDSGGIAATVERLIRTGAVATPRRATLATATAGILLFVETNVSILTAGILGRPIFDRLKISREKLAYVIDSTCAPVSVLILLNGWGAYALALVSPYVSEGQAVGVVAGSIPFNFYALGTVSMVLILAWTDAAFGPMRRTQPRSAAAGSEEVRATRARYMIVPSAIMVFGTLLYML